MKNSIIKIALALAGVSTLAACDMYKIIGAEKAAELLVEYVDYYRARLDEIMPNRFNIRNTVKYTYVANKSTKAIAESASTKDFTALYDAEQKYACVKGINFNISETCCVFYQDETNYYIVLDNQYSEESGGDSEKYFAKFSTSDTDNLNASLKFMKKATLFYSGYYSAAMSILSNLTTFTEETYADMANSDYSSFTTTFKTSGDGNLRSKITLQNPTSDGGLSFKFYSAFDEYVLRNATYYKQNKYDDTVDEKKCNVTETYSCAISFKETFTLKESDRYIPELDAYEEITIDEMLSHQFIATED